MKYALIKDDQVTEYREYPTQVESKHINGKPMLRPVRYVSAVGYDSRIHTKAVTTTITDTEVVQEEALTERPLADVQAESMRRVRDEARDAIESAYPDWYQRNIGMGLETDESAAQRCRDFIAAVRIASNAAEDAIGAATTVTDVVAVTPNWPVPQ